MTMKMENLTEEYNFFRFFHCQFGNISYFCSWIRILYRFIDILNSEARASFSPNGNLRTSNLKTENVVQLFPRLQARTSVIFRFQGFSGPPLEEYRCEVCASVYIQKGVTKILIQKC